MSFDDSELQQLKQTILNWKDTYGSVPLSFVNDAVNNRPNLSDSDISGLIAWLKDCKIELVDDTAIFSNKDDSLFDQSNSDLASSEEISQEDLEKIIDEELESDIQFFERPQKPISRSANIKVKESNRDFNSLFWFYAELSKYKLLSREEEITICKKAHDGDTDALNDLVLHNLKLIPFVEKKYKSNLHTLSILDLFQEGYFGLRKAAERFDYTIGTRFSTYAVLWIRQSITRAISDYDSIIRIPVHVADKFRDLRKAFYNFKKECGCEPSVSELCTLTHQSEEFVLKFYKTFENVTLFSEFKSDINRLYAERMIADDDFIGNPEELCENPSDLISPDFFSINIVPDDVTYSPHDLAETAIIEDQLKSLLTQILKPREYDVIVKRYGLFGQDTLTLDEIGKQDHVTRERIRQIQNKAEAKLTKSAHLAKLKQYML